MVIEITGIYQDGTKPAGTVPQKTPEVQDLDLPRGASSTIKLTVLKQDWTAKDLTGLTVKLAVRKFPWDTSPLFAKTFAGGTPLQGKMDAAITSADMAALEAHFPYVYDVWLIEAGGARYQLVPLSKLTIGGAVLGATE